MFVFILAISACSKEVDIPIHSVGFDCKQITAKYWYNDNGNERFQEWFYDNNDFEIGFRSTGTSTYSYTYEHNNYQHDLLGNVTYKEVVQSGLYGVYKSIYFSTYFDYDKPLTRRIEQVEYSSYTLEEWTYNSLGLEDSYRYSRDDTVRTEVRNYEYDQFGNAVYYEYFDGNGRMIYKYMGTFLNKDKPLTWQRLTVINGGGPSAVSEWFYNEDEYEIGYTVTRWNGVVSPEYKNYLHDEYGNILYFEVYDEYGLETRVRKRYQCHELNP